MAAGSGSAWRRTYAHRSGAAREQPAARRSERQASLVTGASPHGQGTATALAQVVADELGSARATSSVAHGDTAAIPFGVGTYASRNAVVAGNAALGAARRGPRTRPWSLAARLLETAPSDLEFVGRRRPGAGRCRPTADPRSTRLAAAPGRPLPDGHDARAGGHPLLPGAAADLRQRTARRRRRGRPRQLQVNMLDYAVVSDAGPLINPLIVEGSDRRWRGAGHRRGAVRRARLRLEGNFMAQTLLDYCMPSARKSRRSRSPTCTRRRR